MNVCLQGGKWTDVYFTPVACFLVFNVGDYIGRALSTTIPWPKTPSTAAIPTMSISLARIAFIPLFLFCNACPKNRVISDVSPRITFPHHNWLWLYYQYMYFFFQVYIKSDAAYIIVNLCFSVSNGYINSICLMYGPKILSNPGEQSRAASILVFFLMLGLTIGSIFSAPLLHLIWQINAVDKK